MRLLKLIVAGIIGLFSLLNLAVTLVSVRRRSLRKKPTGEKYNANHEQCPTHSFSAKNCSIGILNNCVVSEIAWGH